MQTEIGVRKWGVTAVAGFLAAASLGVLAPRAEAGSTNTSTQRSADLSITETPDVAGDGGVYNTTLFNDSTDFFMMSLPTGRTFSVDIPGVTPGTREVCSVPIKGTGQNTIIGNGGSWLDKDYSTGAVVSTEVLGQIKCVSGGVQYELQYFDKWTDTVRDFCATLSSADGQSWTFSADETCLATVRKGSKRTFVAREAAPFAMTLTSK